MKEQILYMEKELLYRYVSGISDNQEKDIVEKWIQASNENKLEFEQVKQIWELSAKAKKLDTFDSDNALLSVKRKIQKRKSISSTTLFYQVLKFAAIFLAITGIVWLIKLSFFDKTEINMLSFTAKEKQQFTLPDSSTVFLNVGANIRYPNEFSDSVRKIEFSGEGYFQITKNAKKPFIITAGASQIRVIGTAFNLQSNSDESLITLVVTEGKVLFSNIKKESMFLQKGDKGILSKSDSKIRKEINSDKNSLAWKTGIFEFNNTLLPIALNELSKFYPVQFKIGNNELKNMQLTAVYDNLTLNDLLEILKLTLNVEVQQSDSLYIFK